MGQSSSVNEFVGKLHKAARELEDTRRPMIEGAKVAKTLFQTAGASVVGHKVAGKKVSVRYDLLGNDTAVIKYTGPAHLVNNPTSAHQIRPKARRARGRRAAVSVNGNPRAYVQHPGTGGKHFFEKAKLLTHAAVPKIVAREGVTRPLKSIFG